MNEQNKVKVEGEELQERGAKLKACNDRSYARMAEINRIASETLVKTTHGEYEPGQYGQDYQAFGKAVCEIRKICKRDLSGDFPDYEWMAGMMMSKHFDPNRLAQELAAQSPNLKSPNQTIPTFYTPGWLVDLAKKIEGGTRSGASADGTDPAERKHTMDFDKFHVTRMAIPGQTILTFRRKQQFDEKLGSLVPGRIIVADIHRADVGGGRPVVNFIVKSFEPGEKPRVLFSGDMWVCLSKVEKIVYKMVKCNIRESRRRRIMRNRAKAAKRAAANQELINKELA